MNSRFIIIYLILGFITFQVYSLKVSQEDLIKPLCGEVFDGNINGRDLNTQSSEINKIYAQWSGFENGKERNRVLRYEWAIISEDLFTEEMKKEQCRTTPGFRGFPDVMNWENADIKTNVEAEVNSLEIGKTYYIVLRWTTSFGLQFYTNSNGIEIVDEPVMAKVEVNAETSVRQKNPRSVDDRDSNLIAKNLVFNIECPIDAANRCEKSKVSVGEYLEEMYGPAEFQGGYRNYDQNAIFRTAPVGLQLADDDDDDDFSSANGGFGIGPAIGIAIALVAFCFFLFCTCVLLGNIVTGFLTNEDLSDKFKTNVGNKHGNMEDM